MKIKEKIECLYCNKEAKEDFTVVAYETPWDDEPVEKHFCSEECRDEYLYGDDFAYFYCDYCDREICQQNPRNGWHVQYRTVNGEAMCLKCYEEYILENGIEREKFENNQIPGMFFSWNNIEAREAGYQEVNGYINNHITGEESVKRFCEKAIELIDKGYKAVVAYESMAIGGLEGYVTLLKKEGV